MALRALRPSEALLSYLQQTSYCAPSSRILQLLPTQISTPSRILPRLFPILYPIATQIRLPTLGSIWETILRAVPKKKTSHRKKRQRFLAGKALKDVTELNKCSACGHVKKAHSLCPYCVREIKDMWLGRGTKSVEEAKRAATKDSKS